MVINSGGSVINLKDRLQEADRKKTQSDSGKVTKPSSDDSSSTAAKSTQMSDIIGIRNENRLAIASSDTILTSDDAAATLDMLKKQFADDSDTALNAHKQADANSVMQFYPFD